MEKAKVVLKGFEIHKGHLNFEEQTKILEATRDIVRTAPLFNPITPSGKKMSVQMTSSGRFGWLSDRRGYRYSSIHPSGCKWPSIPKEFIDIWDHFVSKNREPDTCLINFYGSDAKMGMHQDKDEKDKNWPVLSVSLGNSGLFRIGNATRGGSTKSIWLESGDVVIMGGQARLHYHGIDRIRFESSPLMKNGGRVNLTMRVVE